MPNVKVHVQVLIFSGKIALQFCFKQRSGQLLVKNRLELVTGAKNMVRITGCHQLTVRSVEIANTLLNIENCL